MTIKVILEVGNIDLVFNPNEMDYNKFINEMQMTNKVSPAHNYLRRIVDKDSKAALDEMLKRPGAALQLAAAVNDEYAPELEIKIKK